MKALAQIDHDISLVLFVLVTGFKRHLVAEREGEAR